MSAQEPAPEHPRNVDGVHETAPAELAQIEVGRTVDEFVAWNAALERGDA